MNETNEMWREIREERRQHLNEQEEFRWNRYKTFIDSNDLGVYEARVLGNFGVRIHKRSWPEHIYVDYWPRTGAIRFRGNSHNGWNHLMAILRREH